MYIYIKTQNMWPWHSVNHCWIYGKKKRQDISCIDSDWFHISPLILIPILLSFKNECERFKPIFMTAFCLWFWMPFNIHFHEIRSQHLQYICTESTLSCLKKEKKRQITYENSVFNVYCCVCVFSFCSILGLPRYRPFTPPGFYAPGPD